MTLEEFLLVEKNMETKPRDYDKLIKMISPQRIMHEKLESGIEATLFAKDIERRERTREVIKLDFEESDEKPYTKEAVTTCKRQSSE